MSLYKTSRIRRCLTSAMFHPTYIVYYISRIAALGEPVAESLVCESFGNDIINIYTQGLSLWLGRQMLICLALACSPLPAVRLKRFSPAWKAPTAPLKLFATDPIPCHPRFKSCLMKVAEEQPELGSNCLCGLSLFPLTTITILWPCTWGEVTIIC